MNVEDRTAPVSDDELEAAIVRMLALVDGIAGAYHCPCGRYYRVGCGKELEAVAKLVRRAINERTGEEPVAETSWFSMLEVD